MARVLDYINYFLHQAEAHPDLLHTETDRVFEVISWEEAMGDFRAANKEKDYILRLLLPSMGADESGDRWKTHQGGYLVAKWHSNRSGTKADFYAALDAAERVGFDIVNKMVADSRNGHPLFKPGTIDTADRLELNVQPRAFTGDGGYSGWLFTFRWASFLPTCTAPADGGPAWTDNGVTPY